MLSGEGNENGESTKKQRCTCSTLFLNITLPLFCTTTMRSFQKLPGYMFHGENNVRVLVHFLFTAAHFHLGGP